MSAGIDIDPLDIIDDPNECKYKIGRVLQLSNKPILSIGTYESLDAECVIAGSSDKNIRFLEITSLDEITRCKVTKRNVSFVAVSEMSPEGDNPIIVTGGKDSVVQVWDPIEGTLAQSIVLPTSEVRSLSIYYGTAPYLMVGTKDAKIIVWDIQKNASVAVFAGHKASVHCVLITTCATDLETQYDMDHLCIASGGADRTVRTWDIATGKRKHKLRHKRSIATMVLANKGARPILATAGVERLIKLWDVESGVLLRSLEGHLDQINCLCLWEGYEMLIISGSSDCTLRVYDILSGECLCVLQGHMDGVLGVTLANKDDPVLVSSSDDLTLIQWSLTDIICDFYNTDDDLLGTRNDRKPDLPTVLYQAPPEIDRNTVPKEERKKMRRETKRLKRLRANDLIKRAVTAVTRSSRVAEQGLTGVTEPGQEDAENDATECKKKWSDDEEDGGGDVARAEAGRSRGGSEDEQEDSRRGVEGAAAGGAARSPEKEDEEERSRVPQSSAGERGATAKEDGSCSLPTRTEGSAADPAADLSGGHPDLSEVHGLMWRSLSTNKIVPVDQATSAPHESAPVGFTMMSLIGKMLGIGGTEKVGIEPEAPVAASASSHASSVKAAGQELPEAEAGGGNDDEEGEEGDAVGGEEDQEDQEEEGDKNASRDGASTAPKAGKRNGRKKKRSQAVETDHAQFRKQAKHATAKYNEAIAAKQVETDKQKSKAAEKLAMRLSMKKGRGVSAADPPTSSSSASAAADASDDTEELHAVKAEKLRQHKLQESNRNQHMLAAKNRAKVQLQKRLEELAAKKKADADAGIVEEPDEDEDDDSDDSS